MNAHTHLYSGLAGLGMPDPKPKPTGFVEILERVWWRLDRALDEDSLRASAELYVCEALALGCVALIDHHESPEFIEGSLDVLAGVCEEFGMHALLCYGVTERNGGADEARRGLAENRRFLERGRQASSPVRGAVGVHASFTVSDETLRAAADLASEFSAALHIHVAEDKADVEDARRCGYGGVIDRLDQLGALQPGAILAHGVHLTHDEVALVSERGCWLVQNPRSNQNNGVGYPVHLAAAQRVALGTDGFPADMPLEHETLMDFAAQAQSSGLPGELAHAAGRLCSGGALALECLGELTAVPTLPTSERRDEVARNAKLQASRLWARMAQF